MFDLNNKVVLLTGASGGIGKSIALNMKKSGAKLILSGTRKNVLEDITSELGGDSKSIVTDLSSKESILNLAKEAENIFGRIDVLINNAGVTADNLFLRMKDEDWDTVLNINLSAGMRLTRHVIKGMLKRKYGRIIFISSIVGFTGNAGQANFAKEYNATVNNGVTTWKAVQGSLYGTSTHVELGAELLFSKQDINNYLQAIGTVILSE